MTAFALNYAIRETKGALKGNLGWLFTIFHLHSDQLLRCFPSNETLKEETGIRHDKTLQKHRDELIAMKALVIVPYEKRLSGKEKGQSPRKIIYQITGVMELPDGTVIPTVYINSRDVLATHVSLLEELGFDTKLIWRAYGEISKPVKSEVSKTAKNEGLKPAKSEDEVVHISSTREVTTTPLPPATSTDGKTTDMGGDVHLALVEMKDAVRVHLKQYGRQNEQVAKSLLGLHVGKNADLNLSRKFTPALLERFGLWWDKNHMRDGRPLTRPKNLDSVKSFGEEFLATLITNHQAARIIYADPAPLPSVTDGMVTFNKPPKKEQAS
jgi:hypothetical protein